jgi:hypothetical protein
MKVLTGIRGVGFLYAYMFFGLGLLRTITPDFGALTSRELQLEGSFRLVFSFMGMTVGVGLTPVYDSSMLCCS